MASNNNYQSLCEEWNPFQFRPSRQVMEISSDDEDDIVFPHHHTSATVPPAPPGGTKIRTADHLDEPIPNYMSDYNNVSNNRVHTGDFPSAKRRKLSVQANPQTWSTRTEASQFGQSTHWHHADDVDQSPSASNGPVFDVDGLDFANTWLPWDFDNFVEDPPSSELLLAQRLQADQAYEKLASRFNIGKLGKVSQRAPYYDDPKLGLRMYCGPGYENFPIPLGKQPEHLAICKIWDKNQLRKSSRSHETQTFLGEQGIHSDHTDPLDAQHAYGGAVDDTVSLRCLECLDKVVSVLPQISHRFALDLIQSMSWYGQDGKEEVPGSPDVIAEILDLDAYPKESSLDSDDEDKGLTKISWSKKCANTPEYQRDAIVLLADEFRYVPTFHISRLVKQLNSLYEAYLTLREDQDPLPTQQSSSPKKAFPRLRQPRFALEKKYARSSPALRNRSQWVSLVSELQAAKQQYGSRLLQRQAQMEKETTEAANLQAQVASGDIIECQCCFDDEIPRNRSVRCQGEEGHLYCYSCVERLAGSNTGSGKYEMCCMSLSGCKAELEAKGVSIAVPKRMLEKLAFYRQLADIAAANISGLEKCPHCDFQGICDPVEVDPIFSCQDPECGRMTCRICLQPAHAPKTCEDVKRETGLMNTRHMIEEARSLAMMRTCPKCHKKVIKEAGCNKMYCTCGGMLCFVCQKDITREGYKHFSQAGCPQHDGNFNRHNHDADAAEREAITKIRTAHPEYKERELRIHVQSIAAPAMPATPRVAPPARPPPPPPAPFAHPTALMMNQLRTMAGAPLENRAAAVEHTRAQAHMDAAAVLANMYVRPPFQQVAWDPAFGGQPMFFPARGPVAARFAMPAPPAPAATVPVVGHPVVAPPAAAWARHGAPFPDMLPMRGHGGFEDGFNIPPFPLPLNDPRYHG